MLASFRTPRHLLPSSVGMDLTWEFPLSGGENLNWKPRMSRFATKKVENQKVEDKKVDFLFNSSCLAHRIVVAINLDMFDLVDMSWQLCLQHLKEKRKEKKNSDSTGI